jgi:arsenate reductase-like glutaredoxin family protein
MVQKSGGAKSNDSKKIKKSKKSNKVVRFDNQPMNADEMEGGLFSEIGKIESNYQRTVKDLYYKIKKNNQTSIQLYKTIFPPALGDTYDKYYYNIYKQAGTDVASRKNIESALKLNDIWQYLSAKLNNRDYSSDSFGTTVKGELDDIISDPLTINYKDDIDTIATKAHSIYEYYLTDHPTTAQKLKDRASTMLSELETKISTKKQSAVQALGTGARAIGTGIATSARAVATSAQAVGTGIATSARAVDSYIETHWDPKIEAFVDASGKRIANAYDATLGKLYNLSQYKTSDTNLIPTIIEIRNQYASKGNAIQTLVNGAGLNFKSAKDQIIKSRIPIYNKAKIGDEDMTQKLDDCLKFTLRGFALLYIAEKLYGDKDNYYGKPEADTIVQTVNDGVYTYNGVSVNDIIQAIKINTKSFTKLPSNAPQEVQQEVAAANALAIVPFNSSGVGPDMNQLDGGNKKKSKKLRGGYSDPDLTNNFMSLINMGGGLLTDTPTPMNAATMASPYQSIAGSFDANMQIPQSSTDGLPKFPYGAVTGGGKKKKSKKMRKYKGGASKSEIYRALFKTGLITGSELMSNIPLTPEDINDLNEVTNDDIITILNNSVTTINEYNDTAMNYANDQEILKNISNETYEIVRDTKKLIQVAIERGLLPDEQIDIEALRQELGLESDAEIAQFRSQTLGISGGGKKKKSKKVKKNK